MFTDLRPWHRRHGDPVDFDESGYSFGPDELTSCRELHTNAHIVRYDRTRKENLPKSINAHRLVHAAHGGPSECDHRSTSPAGTVAQSSQGSSQLVQFHPFDGY